jgi:hypothetical protein
MNNECAIPVNYYIDFQFGKLNKCHEYCNTCFGHNVYDYAVRNCNLFLINNTYQCKMVNIVTPLSNAVYIALNYAQNAIASPMMNVFHANKELRSINQCAHAIHSAHVMHHSQNV